MFEGLKNKANLPKLAIQAAKLQRQMAREEVKVEEGEIKVVATGDQKIRSIEIAGESQRELVKLLNRALGDAQRQAAMKMMGSGSLKGMLGF